MRLRSGVELTDFGHDTACVGVSNIGADTADAFGEAVVLDGDETGGVVAVLTLGLGEAVTDIASGETGAVNAWRVRCSMTHCVPGHTERATRGDPGNTVGGVGTPPPPAAAQPTTPAVPPTTAPAPPPSTATDFCRFIAATRSETRARAAAASSIAAARRFCIPTEKKDKNTETNPKTMS